jgi:superfamily II DNA or RNA helicase
MLMKKKMVFNLSASSLDTYKNSQLQFYFKYILKAEPDTKVNQIYGQAGNIIHKLAEKYIKYRIDINSYFGQKNNSTEEQTNFDRYFSEFEGKWKELRLDERLGFNAKPLNKEDYLFSLENTLRYIEKNININGTETFFSFPVFKNASAEVNIKGFIDAIDTTNHIIYDWKTNSSIEDFTIASKMYCYAYYKKTGKLAKAIYYYCKLDKLQQYEYSIEDLLEFEKHILGIINEIIVKGFDVSQYSAGKYDNVFNEYFKACEQIAFKRKNTKEIFYIIKNNYIKFADDLPDSLRELFDKKFSYFVNGHEFSKLFQSKKWDGKAHLFKRNSGTLPLGLFSILEDFVKDYNDYFNTNYILVLDIDYRKTFKNIEIDFNPCPLDIRYYQEEAVKKALEKRIGILELGTGAGKSLISSEIIRRLKLKTLYVINRIELVDQTVEMFEEYLGYRPGKISEGELNLDDNINIASIQTLNSILKKNDFSTNKLRDYLESVNLLFYDEAQNIKDAGMYKLLRRTLVNCLYIFGTTGTAFRNDEHTLKMKALVGDVIYKKTTEELVTEGYLAQTKCYFLENVFSLEGNVNYHSAYDNFITNNENRNALILDIVKKFDGKKILILTKLIEHGNILKKLINESILITSNTKKQERKDNFQDYRENNFDVLIGSYMIFSTGINLPDLDVIINASGNKTTVGTIQSIGRVMRKSENKKYAYYFDFYDIGSKYFQRATRDRMDILEDFGHKIEVLRDIKQLNIE